jgi:hypothetical protein
MNKPLEEDPNLAAHNNYKIEVSRGFSTTDTAILKPESKEKEEEEMEMCMRE